MEDELPKQMHVFVSWLYSGRILPCFVEPEVLWVLGDILRSPGFANEAMHLMFKRSSNCFMKAATAAYVYGNSTVGSKLRAYTKDVILNEGPLCDAPGVDDVEDWKDLIRQRGDLVVDISLEGSFNNRTSDEQLTAYY